MPNVLHLDVGEMGEDFYGKSLIDNPAIKSLYDIDDEILENPPPDSGISSADWDIIYKTKESRIHAWALSSEYNYMRWTNMRYDAEDNLIKATAPGEIDAKKLDT